jgi:hypothetical protein
MPTFNGKNLLIAGNRCNHRPACFVASSRRALICAVVSAFGAVLTTSTGLGGLGATGAGGATDRAGIGVIRLFIDNILRPVF